MEVMILSFIGPALKEEWNLSAGKESFITNVVFAGMLLGAYTWGFISENRSSLRIPLCPQASSCSTPAIKVG